MSNSNFTKKAIQDAFLELLNEKPLGKITVKDISEKCGVNRNTFITTIRTYVCCLKRCVKMILIT